MSATSSRRLWAIAALVALALAGAGSWLHWSRQPGTVVLRFRATADGAPLTYNRPVYQNPGGDGRFRVRDFQFFVSNIRLISEDGVHAPDESYHLARFDNPDVAFEIVLEGVPPRDYDEIALSLGVDPEANGSLRAAGDLDPNGRMAWSWEVGYKFVLFEGALEVDGRRIPLVYHVGFDENYIPLTFRRDVAVEPRSISAVDFTVDVLKMFADRETIDMAELSTVKFDRDDARLIAANLPRLIAP